MDKATAQEPGKVVYKVDSSEVQLKWYTQPLIYPSGVNVYRRIEGSPEWVRITEEPVRQRSTSLEMANGNSELTLALNVANNLNGKSPEGVVLLNLILESFRSKLLATCLGIYFEDQHVPTARCQYQVRAIIGKGEVIAAQSDWINTGKSEEFSPPSGIRIEQNGRQVNFTWEPEEFRFYGANIYRSTDQINYQKINDLPVIVSDVKEGKHHPFFSDETVKEKQTYYYYLKALNFFGDESVSSPIAFITVPDQTPPAAPISLKKTDVRKNEVSLTCQVVDDPDIMALNLYRSTNFDSLYTRVRSVQSNNNETIFQDVVPEPGGYYYKMTSQDEAGNESESNVIFVQVEDVTPPTIPENVRAASDSGQVSIFWDQVNSKDLLGYRVFRTANPDTYENYLLLNAEPVSTNQFVDYSVNRKNKNNFYYTVASVDSSLNVSPFSQVAQVKLTDCIAPERPVIKHAVFENNWVKISWVKNVEPDLAGYQLYRKNKESKQPAYKINKVRIAPDSTFFYDFDLAQDETVCYTLVAEDSSGNVSSISEGFVISVPSLQPLNDLPEIVLKSKYKRKSGVVKLAWTLNSATNKKMQVEHFTLYKKKGAGSFKKVYGNQGVYFCSDKEKKDASYQIRGYLNNGIVIYSNIVSIKP